MTLQDLIKKWEEAAQEMDSAISKLRTYGFDPKVAIAEHKMASEILEDLKKLEENSEKKPSLE
jgi:hypothetical protein